MPSPSSSRRAFLQQVAGSLAAPIVLPAAVSGQGAAGTTSAGTAPILVVLWFDTEDYILTEDDDATLRLATMLTRLGVTATFKVVGEKARVLEQRGRGDVIEALRHHAIGYHSNTHSQQPTIAVYLQHAGWKDGIDEFLRREAAGARDVGRILGVTPVAYGQPGSAWAPQAYPALRQMGIRLYLDEADHVGLDDQPFYYGGLLNVFRMRSTLVRMELAGGSSLEDGKAAFSRVARTLAARGGGTVSIYYHPNEWVQTEFWDAVNFSKGANPPRSAWRRPGTRPPRETEAAFADFEQFIRFILAQPGVRFVTPQDLLERYADRSADYRWTIDDVREIARACRSDIGFLVRGALSLSPADTFSVLTAALAGYAGAGHWPASVQAHYLDGPARPHVAAAGRPAAGSIPWDAYTRALIDTVSAWEATSRVPDEIWIGAESMSPADFLATTATVIDLIGTGGAPPAEVRKQEGRLTSDRYVADDAPALWNWPIFPEGFHAPDLMALAKLQAWTLKPAMLRT